VAAPLESRQLWWTLTVVFTAAGLGVTAFGKSPWRWLGLALLAAPHLIGAPHLGTSPFAEYPANVQPEMMQLASRFIWATAIANAVFWLAVGSASAWTVRRFLKDALM
jgi:predicted cobalt transporter CbtA